MLQETYPDFHENPDRFPTIFEIVPPEVGKEKQRLNKHIKYIGQMFREIEVDALNLPEIQDESKKCDKGKRLKPYKKRVSPRDYALALSEQFDTEFIINQVCVKRPPKKLEKWLLETHNDFNIKNIIMVGGESSKVKYNGPSVAASNKLLKRYLNRGRLRHNDEPDEIEPTEFTIGNICIPTRRRNDFDEPERMMHKYLAGADFFTSQIITETETPISLMKDFHELLIEEDKEPPLIYWSFSPISSQKDVNFLRWLGVHIPELTEKLILGSKDPVSASLNVAQNVWDKLIDFNRQLPVSFPMGINISVMGLRNFENGIQLAKDLNMIAASD